MPLKNKLGKTVVVGLKSVLAENRKHNTMSFDKGRELNNRLVKIYMASEKVSIRFTHNKTKSNYAERFIKTMKSMLYRHFTITY